MGNKWSFGENVLVANAKYLQPDGLGGWSWVVSVGTSVDFCVVGMNYSPLTNVYRIPLALPARFDSLPGEEKSFSIDALAGQAVADLGETDYVAALRRVYGDNGGAFAQVSHGRYLGDHVLLNLAAYLSSSGISVETTTRFCLRERREIIRPVVRKTGGRNRIPENGLKVIGI